MIIPNIKIEPAQPPSPPPPEPKSPGQVLHENGVLFMTDVFSMENCLPIIKGIMEYNMLPESKRPEVIHLYINSRGGELAACWHLIDVLKQSKIPVWTYALGIAASCGCLLLMAGEKGHRYITQNTTVMTHVFSAGSVGKEHELHARVKSFEQTSKNMVEHYKKCTGKTEAYIRKHLLPKEDVWLSTEECIKHGIADNIIETY